MAVSEAWAAAFAVVGASWAVAWLFVSIVRAALADGRRYRSGETEK